MGSSGAVCGRRAVARTAKKTKTGCRCLGRVLWLNERRRVGVRSADVPAGAIGSGRMGSERSAPPSIEHGGQLHPLAPHLHFYPHLPHPPHLQTGGLAEIELSMTPENIKPLLKSANEVHVRCRECIQELHVLLNVTIGSGSGPGGGLSAS